MPGSPSVTLPGWLASVVHGGRGGGLVQGQVGARAALSMTDRVHSEEPQPVARVRHLIRTYRACCAPRSTDWV